MAYIDYLRKNNDKPVVGTGGINDVWKSLVNIIQNAVAPKKQSVPNYVKAGATPAKSAPKVSAPAPSWQPQKSSTSYSAPTQSISKPSSSFSSPVQQSKVQISLPKAASPTNLPTYKAPIPVQQLPKPTMVNSNSLSKNIQASPFGQQLNKWVNDYQTRVATNPSQTVKPGVFSAAGKVIQNIGTSLHAPQLVPGGIGARMQVMASDSTLKPTKGPSTLSETSDIYKYNRMAGPGQGIYGKSDIRSSVTPEQVNAANTGYETAQKQSDQTYEDIYAILNDPGVQSQMDAAYNDAMSYYNEGGDYEGAMKRYNEEQQKIVMNQYNRLKADAEGQIPGIEAEIAAAIAGENEGLNRYKATIDQTKTKQGLTYDENLRRAVTNAKLNEGNLRNTFTNLGTAESSAFIDKMRQLASESGSEQAGIDRSKAETLGGLDTQLLNETTDTNKRIGQYRTEGDQKLAEIRKYIQDLGGQSADQISQLISDLGNALTAGQGKVAEMKYNTAQAKQNQLMGIQNAIAQGEIGTQQAIKQATALNDINGVQKGDEIIGGKYVRPKGFSSTLWNSADKLYQSGLRGAQLISQLKKMGIGDAQDWMYNYLLNPS